MIYNMLFVSRWDMPDAEGGGGGAAAVVVVVGVVGRERDGRPTTGEGGGATVSGDGLGRRCGGNATEGAPVTAGTIGGEWRRDRR